MRLLPFVPALLSFAAAAPQRGIGGCGCREVICPNQGPDHCACINAAAEDCSKYQRGDCPQPPRCIDSGRPNQNGGGRGGQGQNPIYTTMPITYTVTTILPGFYSPNPVTSFSTIVSLVTITLNGPPPQNPDLNGPQTIWQTTTVNGIPPWASRPQPPGNQLPPNQNNQPRPTTPRITPTRPPPTPINQNPPKATTPVQPPWAVPPAAPAVPLTPFEPASSPRPAPWKPPGNPTQTWTPINNPTIPASQPTSPAQPPPPPAAPPVGPPIPTDVGQAPPVAGAPVKCGPGQPVCKDGTYCDPQPLCSIGEDCAGVCLPTFSVKFATDGFSQPWSVRRTVWQGLLKSGNYSVYSFNGTF